MTEAERNCELTRRLVDLYNTGTADWVDACHHPQSQWYEMPTATFPHGRSGGRDDLRAAAEHAIGLVPDRKMTIRRLVAGGDQVALELDWAGTLAASLSDTLREGTYVRLRVAMFLTFSAGQVVEQIDYPIPLGEATGRAVGSAAGRAAH